MPWVRIPICPIDLLASEGERDLSSQVWVNEPIQILTKEDHDLVSTAKFRSEAVMRNAIVDEIRDEFEDSVEITKLLFKWEEVADLRWNNYNTRRIGAFSAALVMTFGYRTKLGKERSLDIEFKMEYNNWLTDKSPRINWPRYKIVSELLGLVSGTLTGTEIVN